MMKSKYLLISMLAIAVLGFGTGGVAAYAEVSHEDVTAQTENVARGKIASFTDKDGAPIAQEDLLSLQGTPLTMYALTDGNCEPGAGHDIIEVKDHETGAYLRAFAVIDLGEDHTITSIGTSFWNDHYYGGIVMQVATQADFSDAVTVFNNDVQNLMGQGYGENIDYLDIVNKITVTQFSPVYGRYVRVSGYSTTEGQTRFSEIEVYAVTSGVMPVTSNIAAGKANRSASVELKTATEGAKVYYTTDGKFPSEKSTEYTQPIKLSTLGTFKAYIRAIAITEDGSRSMVSELKYDMKESVHNVALGKIPTVKGAEPTILQGDPSTTIAKVTDGAEDPNNVMGTKNTAAWLHIDLGALYRVDTVKVKLWHDWAFGAIIQLSTTEDFSSGNYTVFSNYGKGSGIWEGVDFVPMTADEWYGGFREFTFKPVEARYIRVWSYQVTNESDSRSMWEEVQVYTAAKPDEAYEQKAENVALGKVARVDGAVPESILGSATMAKVTDGGEDPNNVMGTKTTAAWLYIDLLSEYTVDKVKVKLFHDWEHQAIIQLSTTEDFSSGNYTVFSNYGYGGGWDNVENVPKTADEWFIGYKEFTFEPVQARYIRVYGKEVRNGDFASMWEEVQVWSHEQEGKEIPEEGYPTAEKAIVKADIDANKTVPNGSSQADLALPATVNVEDREGNKGTLTGTWTCENYQPTVAGDYVFTFSCEGDEWSDVYALLKIKVTVAPAADKSELNALIEELAAIQSDKLVTDSQTALSAALEAAREVNDKRLVFQSEVDAAKAALEGAKEKLVYRGDKTQLNAEIAKATALKQDDYTKASWDAMKEKLTAAQTVAGNEDATQTAVDAALTDLKTACEELKKLGDKAQLQARYEELKGTQSSAYTAASWASFHEKLTNAKTILDKAEPLEDEVDTALAQLNAAFEALVEKADFSALSEKVTAVRALAEAEYTSSSWAELQTALEEAEAVLANDESTQDAVGEALAELTAKQNALVKRGDKTALQTLVNGLPHKAEDYTADTFNAYLEAKGEAEAVLADKDATQEELDAAKTALENAVSGLKRAADKTALNEAIEQAAALDETQYSSASYAAFEEALEYARQIVASNTVSQEQVDAALNALNAAKDALESAGGSGCGSVVSGFGISALALGLGAAVFCRKKKKNEEDDEEK